ncbi:MAG: SDR family NAD(P)-dependent oxidoreductase [Thermoplasmata archaeon]|nr:SDR family NAD(P)-dependent oxidoreductase [Thermoplasmata archaeon]
MPEKNPSPVLVTGASTGIGRAIDNSLSSNGHPVFAGARKESDLEALGRLPHVTPVLLDVTQDQDVARLAAQIRDSKKGLYGLVNNAGIGNAGPLVEISVEELHLSFDVNVDGLHRMARGMFPFLRESRGRVVNISSINGFVPEAFFGPLCNQQVRRRGVQRRASPGGIGLRVSSVEPGAFRSDIFANAMEHQADELREEWGISIYRDQLLEFLNGVTASKDALYRADLPLPTPVVDAVSDALFSRTRRHGTSSAPRRRSMSRSTGC